MSTDAHPDTHLLHTGGCFFEGPRWHAGRWWVSDMYGDTVLGLSPSGTVDVELPLPDHPSGLGWTPDGDLLVVLMQERTVVRVDGARRLSAYAPLAGYGRGPANDMIVDASGRAWVGFLGFDMNAGEKPETTDLVCIQPDGGTSRAADGLLTPNGLALIGHGRELLIAETFASRICSFRVDADGVLHQRRAWAQLAPPPPVYDLRSCLRALRVAPDGLAIDAWDHVWFADAAGGGCVRAFGGAVLERVPPPPGLQIFACAVGGAAGNTLLMCCAPDAIEGRRRAAAQSVLITAQISAPGEGTLN
jgi:sugar lactone lactonase YvrE